MKALRWMLFLFLLAGLFFTRVTLAQDRVMPNTFCIQARVIGYQPKRTMLDTQIIQAGRNTVPGTPLAYPQLNRGIPPHDTQVTVSSSEPIPPVLLKAVWWQESRWLQFADAFTDRDDRTIGTLIAGDCGYGMSQYTDCMKGEQSCASLGIDPQHIASNLDYNLSAGVRVLAYKWNGATPYLGENDHTFPEEWYYGAMAYNGYTYCNNPNRRAPDNRCSYLPIPPYDRPPYSDVYQFPLYTAGQYTYQEKVWGEMDNPYLVLEDSNNALTKPFWRYSYYAPVPRGMFGHLSENWQPKQTPRPQMHLYFINRNGVALWPRLTLKNSTNNKLAYDLLFYDKQHHFVQRWLVNLSQPARYLEANETTVLDIGNAGLPTTYEGGYLRIHAVEGITTTLENLISNKLHLPVVTVPRSSTTASSIESLCDGSVSNGGFEQLTHGQPSSWKVASTGAYSLVDSTWFTKGHYGAHLGGYNGADDRLTSNQLILPPKSGASYLKFSLNVWSKESYNPSYKPDTLQLNLRNPDGTLIRTVTTFSNHELLATKGYEWIEKEIGLHWFVQRGKAFTLSFEAKNDGNAPTDFFIDEVELDCLPPLREAVPTHITLVTN